MKTLVAFIVLAASVTAQPNKLTPDEFVVKPGIARYWSFSTGGGRVTGQFRASGGSNNDIRVVITDSDGCINYLNGNRGNWLYDSGKTTVGRIDLGLSPGAYCIIFDNSNSVVSSKEVAARIYLQ